MSRHYFRTFTVSIATPAVFTLTDHGLEPGDTIILTTTGALPTGLTATTYKSETRYYVVRHGLSTSAFEVSTLNGVNNNGTSVVTSGSQSGVHTFLKINHDRLQPIVEDTK